jgi:hypothetical protein
MKKLNIITGTSLFSYKLQENMKSFDLLFKSFQDNGLQFKEKTLGESVLEARNTKDKLGLTEDAIYFHYENYILPIRSAAFLKNLKTDNISYKVINIKHSNKTPLSILHSHQSDSARIAEETNLKLELSQLENEFSESLANASVFEVLNVSVADLDSRLPEIISFLKN